MHKAAIQKLKVGQASDDESEAGSGHHPELNQQDIDGSRGARERGGHVRGETTVVAHINELSKETKDGVRQLLKESFSSYDKDQSRLSRCVYGCIRTRMAATPHVKSCSLSNYSRLDLCCRVASSHT